jgi:general nucleoside transport system permease protein
MISTLIMGTLVLSAPLILAAMGGLASERSGIINIALEGKMLIAAVAVWLVSVGTHNALLGLGAGILAASILSLLHWLLTQKFAIDHIVSGMAVNAVAFGGSNFLDKKFTNPSQVDFPRLPLAAYWVFGLLLPVLIWLYLKRTRGGLRLLAVGNDPDKARQMGVSPSSIRLVSLLATGLFCGIAGSLIVSNAGSFNDGMTAGRGFIALAALIIGGWRPLPALAACIFFGMLQQLQIQLQNVPIAGIEIPGWVWLSLPYAATIIVLAGFLGKDRTPAGLGKQ